MQLEKIFDTKIFFSKCQTSIEYDIYSRLLFAAWEACSGVVLDLLRMRVPKTIRKAPTNHCENFRINWEQINLCILILAQREFNLSLNYFFGM